MGEPKATISVQPFPGPSNPINVDALLDGGWVYRDIPWMTGERWDELMGWIGGGNVEVLAMSSRDNGIKRGQIIISPAGIEALRRRITQ